MIASLWLKFQNFILVGAVGVAIGVAGSSLVSNTLNFKVPLVGWKVQGTAVQLRAAKAELRDPVTGFKWQDLYIVSAKDLATCRANNARLENGITEQNQRIQAQSDKDRIALEQAQKDSQTSKSALAAAEADRRKLLSKLPQGIDFCARVKDVDDRFLETLK